MLAPGYKNSFKYNLALIPQKKSDEIVNFAQKLSDIADEYMLGANSLPHVTLYQFEAEEEEITDIWGRVCEVWEEKAIDLDFANFSCLTFDNNIFWVSLLPNNSDALHKMHHMMAGILGLPIKKSFDPHMTLISSKSKGYKMEVEKASGSYNPITDTFVLALGQADDIGQLTRVCLQFY